jgi:hypothetical protein
MDQLNIAKRMPMQVGTPGRRDDMPTYLCKEGHKHKTQERAEHCVYCRKRHIKQIEERKDDMELKPCPWCDAIPILRVTFGRGFCILFTNNSHAYDCPMNYNFDTDRIYFRTKFYKTKREAIKAWNDRKGA